MRVGLGKAALWQQDTSPNIENVMQQLIIITYIIKQYDFKFIPVV